MHTTALTLTQQQKETCNWTSTGQLEMINWQEAHKAAKWSVTRQGSMIHWYNFSNSFLYRAFRGSRFNFRAAVTNPDSGVQDSGINLILAGSSNLSNLAAFATWKSAVYITKTFQHSRKIILAHENRGTLVVGRKIWFH